MQEISFQPTVVTWRLSYLLQRGLALEVWSLYWRFDSVIWCLPGQFRAAALRFVNVRLASHPSLFLQRANDSCLFNHHGVAFEFLWDAALDLGGIGRSHDFQARCAPVR